MNENINLLNERLEAFPLSCVTLLDPYEKNAFKLEVKYLKSLDPDRLLRGFYDIAGLKGKAELYGGWETSNIQGHTMGHYLTALAQAFAACGDRELKTSIDYIIDSLCECQAENGYLAAIPEEHYTRLETGNTDGTWVPWYSMHKILSGLIAVYKFTSIQKALDIASRLGDWVFDKTIYWDAEMQKTVLNIEYGGMNDCLYDLYSLTLKKEHLAAAHCFDELPLFTALYMGEDILDGKHANTTIPKFLGAANRYFVLGEGEEFYLLAAMNFWDTVVNNHSYITGGNSEWEHFGTPNILDAERTECNCETCNTYNMLKLTRRLFMLTGNRKYRDYYESTFINAILSSQNPETGMTTYFQPMATGFFKVYSSPFDHFWCCTGSGMENFSKLGDSIYFKNSSRLYVNRFTSSAVDWAEKGITLTQKAELPNICFTIEGNADFSLVIPLPSWCKEAPGVKINGETVEITEENGFISLNRSWSDGDKVEYTLPMKVEFHRLPDNKNAICLTYGPYALSADLGRENMGTSVTGVNVTIPLGDEREIGKIKVNGDVEEWLTHIEDNFEPTGEEYTFRLKNADRELIFAPHYKKYNSRYGIYFVVE